MGTKNLYENGPNPFFCSVPKIRSEESNLWQRFLKKNQNTPRPSEHPPLRGKKMSKRLGGIIGCKYKTSSWNLNGFPYGSNIGSTV